MSFTFASPNWAWWLFVLPVIALLKIAADARARRVTLAFAASERLRSLMQGGASLVRSGVRFGLQLLGLAFFIIALTRPQYGSEEKQVEQTGRNILIAMDCSKSMLADDVKPNRLTRSKLAAQDLLDKLPGDRVGVIAFAGRSFLQAPLTTDHQAIIDSLQSLDHTTIPRGGSSLASAIKLAVQTVDKMPGRQHGLIIFTDGQETDNAMLEAARDARAKNLMVLPVGVGTVAGEVIPDPDPQRQGEFLRDENGKIIRSRLEAAALQELARASGGEFVALNSQSLTQTVVDRLLSNLDRHQAESRQFTRPIERYQILLFAGIFSLVMSLLIAPSSRRPVGTAPLPVDPLSTVHRAPPIPVRNAVGAWLALLFILGTGIPAMAATREELSGAKRSYDEGRYDRSRDSYQRMTRSKKNKEHSDEVAYGLGASALKLKDYDAALRSFSDALHSGDANVQLRAQRGLGTALYDQGEQIFMKQPDRAIKAWTESVEHFDGAMRRTTRTSKEYQELKDNRDFVQQRLDDLKKQREMEKEMQQKEAGKKKGKGQGSDSAKTEPQQDSEEGGKNDQNEDSKGDKDDSKKKDALQKGDAVPEGQIRAGESGKVTENDKPVPNDQDKRNEKTGYTPEEARSQLRNYADDQRSMQYLMREERPVSDKDY